MPALPTCSSWADTWAKQPLHQHPVTASISTLYVRAIDVFEGQHLDPSSAKKLGLTTIQVMLKKHGSKFGQHGHTGKKDEKSSSNPLVHLLGC